MSPPPGSSAALLASLEQWLAANKVKESRLGRDVMRDPSFVRELRAGRVVRASTVQRLQAYMAQREVSP